VIFSQLELKDEEILILSDSGLIPSLYIRLVDPLSRFTNNYNILTSDEVGASTLTRAVGLVVVHRWFNTPILKIAEEVKLRNIPLIYETDDNFIELSGSSATSLSKEHIENIKCVMRIADVVLCSTQTLADFIRAYNSRVMVLENYGLIKPLANIDAAPHLAVVNTDYFKLGSTKGAFFAALKVALEQLDYKITFFGSIDPAMRALKASYPYRVHIIDNIINDRAAFLDRLVESGVNVAAVPLEETWQHSFKSDIKFLDFASAAIPGIYNNRAVYYAVQHRENGFFCSDTQDGWLEGLAFFQSTFNRKYCGHAARSMIENGRSIDDYARGLSAAFKEVMSFRTAPRDASDASFSRTLTQIRLSDDETPKGGLGFGWDNERLIVFDGSVRRHVASVDLVPVLLDLGLEFFDPDCEQITSAPFGLPIKNEGDFEAFGIRGATARTEAKNPPAVMPLAADLPKRKRMPDLGRALKIAWILPDLVIGGGGHRNIIRCAYQLEQRGHDVSLYFIDTADNDATIRRLVHEHFYPFEGRTGAFDGVSAARNDIVMATHWSTVKVAESIRSEVGEIIYFVQDFEPSFYAMGSEYILAEATYRKGLYAITSGIWCEKVLRKNFAMEADHFQFPVDRSVYFDSETTLRSNRILFFAKPGVSRRCFELGVEALRRFHRLQPDVEIAFFGADDAGHQRMDFPVTQLGMLPTIGDLAALYRSSRAGIVFSTTNPSLVPYEMMACGLPIFDLGRPGNEQNYADKFDIARLVNPDPAIMAVEIAALLENETELCERSRKGLEFVSSFPTEEEVGARVEALILQRVAKWNETRLMTPSQVTEVSSAGSVRTAAG
jgi:glycosyltransferase involved in cell wall biosynthesis